MQVVNVDDAETKDAWVGSGVGVAILVAAAGTDLQALFAHPLAQ
jgi:hypothetical protein